MVLTSLEEQSCIIRMTGKLPCAFDFPSALHQAYYICKVQKYSEIYTRCFPNIQINEKRSGLPQEYGLLSTRVVVKLFAFDFYDTLLRHIISEKLMSVMK